MLTFGLPCCVISSLVQRGAEAFGQGVAARTSLGAELALCTVFGIWVRRNVVMRKRRGGDREGKVQKKEPG